MPTQTAARRTSTLARLSENFSDLLLVGFWLMAIAVMGFMWGFALIGTELVVRYMMEINDMPLTSVEAVKQQLDLVMSESVSQGLWFGGISSLWLLAIWIAGLRRSYLHCLAWLAKAQVPLMAVLMVVNFLRAISYL
ncbi:hypothetical protein JNJ66_01760 [Candidatus Saccharibacteria bacterium]|nr:hypothetical protein [Candidatus Saccharibacteria bacterium]